MEIHLKSQAGSGLSLHPTMTEREVRYIAKSIKQLVLNHKQGSKNYKKREGENNFFFAKNQSKPLNGDSAKKYFKRMAFAA